MRRLIVTDFLTLDGVMEAPGMEDHPTGRNAWALRFTDPELERHNQDQTYSAEAILLGRKTYEIWAAFWPTASGDEVFARRMNEVPKYVVSRSLKDPAWANTTVLSGDVAAEVAALKARATATSSATGAASSSAS